VIQTNMNLVLASKKDRGPSNDSEDRHISSVSRWVDAYLPYLIPFCFCTNQKST